MRKILLSGLFLITLSTAKLAAQDISMRVQMISFSAVDPDGGGPANGSVVLEFQLASSAGVILADGMGLLFAYQSASLMPTPTNTTIAVGPLASATGWTQNVDNRVGNPVAVSYGGRNFDKRMVIAFAQGTATPNMPVTTTFTGIARVTYWTLGASNPQGGYIVAEAGAIVPQNSLSSDNGGTEYPYLSPNTPLALGSGPVTPVIFTYFNADCNDKGALLTWETATEENADYYEVQRSADGANWKTVDKVDASGNSAVARQYQYLDLEGGNVQYRLRQVDIDGKTTYTSIRRTSCEGKSFSTTLYPVPARDKMTLVVRSDRAVTTNLQILDMNGKMVKQMRTNINNGNTNIVIDVNSLPQGEYMLMSSDPSVRINKKFVVAR